MSAFLRGRLAEYLGADDEDDDLDLYEFEDDEIDIPDGGSELLPNLARFIDFDAFGRFPIDGGIRDQEPFLMDDFRILIGMKREFEREQEKKSRG